MEAEQLQLTVQEALAQGYEHYFYNSDGWQAMKSLSDIGKGYEVDWSRNDIYIVEKKSEQVLSLGEGELKGMIVDQFESTYYDLTSNDDPNVINDAFSTFDFKPFEEAIDKVLEGITCYRATKIKLAP